MNFGSNTIVAQLQEKALPPRYPFDNSKNLLEEIEKILPVNEDPDLANKIKIKKNFSKEIELKKDGA